MINTIAFVFCAIYAIVLGMKMEITSNYIFAKIIGYFLLKIMPIASGFLILFVTFCT